MDDASTDAMVAAALAAHDRTDILVNCAGFGQDIAFLDTPVAVLDRIMAVNVRGTFVAAQACGRAMRDAGSGAFINIGSGRVSQVRRGAPPMAHRRAPSSR